jgi:hypothetical protein
MMEHSHPNVIGLSKEDALRRIMYLDPDKKACHIRKISSKHLEDLNLDIVCGDIKPVGPYSKYAEEQLSDPTMNFSTSLRAITSMTQKPNGVSFRKMLQLVTFDCSVPSGGFQEASKRYQIAQEEIVEFIDPTIFLDNNKRDSNIGFESMMTRSELNDIFEAAKIKITGKVSGIYLGEHNLIYDEKTGKRSSIMTTLL